eukprot:2030145-Prymnesium_polylepis.1
MIELVCVKHKAAVACPAVRSRACVGSPSLCGYLADDIAATHKNAPRTRRVCSAPWQVGRNAPQGRSNLSSPGCGRQRDSHNRAPRRLVWLHHGHELTHRWVIEDERAGEGCVLTGSLLKLIAQLDRSKRVETSFHQRRV